MFSFFLLGIYFLIHVIIPGGTVAKNPPVNVGDSSSNPRSGRSLGVGNSYPLQYSVKTHRQRSLVGYSHGVAKGQP